MEDDYSSLIANSFTNPLSFNGFSAAEILSGQANQNANTPESGTEGTNNTAEILRYPESKIESSTDYFSLSLFDYTGGSDIYGLGNAADNTDQGNKALSGLLDGLRGKADAIETEINNPGTEEGSKLIQNLQTIFLPMPQNISDTMSVGYAEDSLNPLQVVGLQAARGITDLFLKDSENNKNVFSANDAANAIERLGKLGADPEVVNALKNGMSSIAINQLGANVRPQSIITRASGQILQSNLELLFNNVTLRSFSFGFDFAPRNPGEAETVARIIRTIKTGMTPRKGENPSIFIKSPKLAKIAYMKGSQPHPFLHKMKTGVITDMSINYTGSGTYATYNDGTPVHMRMEFTFKEINPIYADDYSGEGDLSEAVGRGVGY